MLEKLEMVLGPIWTLGDMNKNPLSETSRWLQGARVWREMMEWVLRVDGGCEGGHFLQLGMRLATRRVKLSNEKAMIIDQYLTKYGSSYYVVGQKQLEAI